MAETDEQRLERIERGAKRHAADMQKMMNPPLYIPNSADLRFLLAHARRSVEAQAAEDEVESGAAALRKFMAPSAVCFGMTDGDCKEAARIVASAARMWRDANPAHVVIDEAMAIRAFQVFDQHHGSAVEAMRAALTAALTKEG